MYLYQTTGSLVNQHLLKIIRLAQFLYNYLRPVIGAGNFRRLRYNYAKDNLCLC
jgi:hypothetical protein